MNWSQNGKNHLQSKNKVQYVAPLDPKLKTHGDGSRESPAAKKQNAGLA